MNKPSDILVQRFSEGEMSAMLYMLLGSLVLALVAYFIGAWYAARGEITFFQALGRGRRKRNPLSRKEEGDLKPFRSERRRPWYLAFLALWPKKTYKARKIASKRPQMPSGCVNTTFDDHFKLPQRVNESRPIEKMSDENLTSSV